MEKVSHSVEYLIETRISPSSTYFPHQNILQNIPSYKVHRHRLSQVTLYALYLYTNY